MNNNIDANPIDWNIDASWTLFLDRDGVINERIMSGYVTSIEEFHFLPGVISAINQFTQVFQYIFVVTNQQGIAKGLMSERNLSEIHHVWVAGKCCVDNKTLRHSRPNDLEASITLWQNSLEFRKPA